MGLTREQVRQIQMDALKRLRRILENKGLSGKPARQFLNSSLAKPSPV
ncbi:MAG: hypothetical protein R3E89_00845 [Thiolinea sp.]